MDAPASARAVEPGFAGEVAVEPLDEPPEPPDEVAAESPDELPGEVVAEPPDEPPEPPDEVVAEPPDELPEPPDEQPTTPSPTAKTQSVTDMDVRNRMESLCGRRPRVVLPGHRVYGFNTL